MLLIYALKHKRLARVQIVMYISNHQLNKLCLGRHFCFELILYLIIPIKSILENQITMYFYLSLGNKRKNLE